MQQRRRRYSIDKDELDKQYRRHVKHGFLREYNSEDVLLIKEEDRKQNKRVKGKFYGKQIRHE